MDMAPTMPRKTPPIGRDIGEKLAQLAFAQGLTQGQVAIKAKLSQPTISALFGGSIKDPPISTVLQTTRALGASLDQVVGIAPMPTVSIRPPASDVGARLDLLEDLITGFLTQAAGDNDEAAAALERLRGISQPKRADESRPAKRGRKAS